MVSNSIKQNTKMRIFDSVQIIRERESQSRLLYVSGFIA